MKDISDLRASTGGRFPEVLRSSLEEVKPEPTQRRDFPAIEDAAVYLTEEIEIPAEVIIGLLHRGSKGVLGGNSKSCKTWMLTDMAVSVATGAEWLGHQCVQGRVLYINLELQRGFFAKRTKIVSEHRALPFDKGVLHAWNLRGRAADLSTMIAEILDGAGTDRYELIVIDPIYKVMGGRDENKAGDIGSLLNEIERLTVLSGAAVVFGAHFSKGSQAGKESIDRIGGSGVFARDPDTILVFTKHKVENAFSVEATLRNYPPIEPFVVRWKFPLMTIDEQLDPAELKQKAGRPQKAKPDEVLDLLTEEMSSTEWQQLAQKQLSISPRSFHRRRLQLREDGRVKKSAITGNYQRAE